MQPTKFLLGDGLRATESLLLTQSATTVSYNQIYKQK